MIQLQECAHLYLFEFLVDTIYRVVVFGEERIRDLVF